MDKRDGATYVEWNITHPEINEIRPVGTTLEELHMIILSDICQKEKDTYHKMSLKGGIKNGYTWNKLQNRNIVKYVENTHKAAKLESWGMVRYFPGGWN